PVDIFRQQRSSLLLHNTTFKSKLSIQKLFIIHFAVSHSPFTQTVTFAYYTVCEAKNNVYLKKKQTNRKVRLLKSWRGKKKCLFKKKKKKIKKSHKKNSR